MNDKELNEKLAEVMECEPDNSCVDFWATFPDEVGSRPFDYSDPAIFAENISALVNLYFSVNFFKNGNQWGVDCIGWENQPSINISQCVSKEEATALARIAAEEGE